MFELCFLMEKPLVTCLCLLTSVVHDSDQTVCQRACITICFGICVLYWPHLHAAIANKHMVIQVGCASNQTCSLVCVQPRSWRCRFVGAPRVSAPDLACKQAASCKCDILLGIECLLLGFAWTVSKVCKVCYARWGW